MPDRRRNISASGQSSQHAHQQIVGVEIVAARAGVTTRRIRYLQRAGIVEPVTRGSGRSMFDEAAIERVMQAERLINDLGVNLAGVEVILNMRERMMLLLEELDQLQNSKVRRSSSATRRLDR